MFNDPEVKMLWRASATAEMLLHHEEEELTDKTRQELIKLHEYRNNKETQKGTI